MSAKHLMPVFLAVMLAAPFAAGAQSGPPIPEDPDSLFGTDAAQGDTAEPAAGPAPDDAAAGLLKARGVEVGGTLISNYTAFLTWADAYPELSDPGAGLSDRFVPNLESDLYFDARPFETLRVFTKLKAVYPFSSGRPASGAPSTPLSPLPNSSAAAVPNISIFEAYADLAYRDRLYFRAGQQVVNWGVGWFFSPADVFSLVPIDPMRPSMEREGPLALRLSAPFAQVDNLYFYVVADRGLAESGDLRLEDLAVASRVEIVLGGYEIGLGVFYQENRRPKAVATVTGPVLGGLGIFGEAVASRGKDRITVHEASGAPGAYLTSSDSTTPVFSGTIGLRYVQPDWHVRAVAQYYYNGQGYTNLARQRDAFTAYALQLQGAPPEGPSLSAADVLQSGMHYLAGFAGWTDILGSKIDLTLFYEGNLSDGSGVVAPGVSYTPLRYFTLGFSPYFGYGPLDSEFVSLFGRLSLSLKLTLGEGAF